MVAATIAPPIHRSEYVARFYEGDDLLIPRLPKSTADVFELAVETLGRLGRSALPIAQGRLQALLMLPR